MKTFNLMLANQVDLVVTPDAGFESSPDIEKQSSVQLNEDSGVWLITMSVCEHCRSPIKVNFCLGNYLSVNSVLMEAAITCRKCLKTQIKKIKYRVEDTRPDTRPERSWRC